MEMLRSKMLIFGLLFSISSILADDCVPNTCDKLGILIYEDLGCKPVKKPGVDCPIKYNCDFTTKAGNCLFRNLQIPFGERIPNELTSGTCDIGCVCSANRPAPANSDPELKTPPGAFRCAIIECIELGIPAAENCYRKYKLDSCCSGEEVCFNNGTKPNVCEIDGEIIKEGRLIFPKNTCSRCVCPKNFNGKFGSQDCMRRRCDAQIRYQKEILNYCAPVYLNVDGDVLCCPTQWVCPTANDKIITINPNADKSSQLTCQFGKKSIKLGDGLETSIKGYDDRLRPIRCECDLPPFLTCKEIKQ